MIIYSTIAGYKPLDNVIKEFLQVGDHHTRGNLTYSHQYDEFKLKVIVGYTNDVFSQMMTACRIQEVNGPITKWTWNERDAYVSFKIKHQDDLNPFLIGGNNHE